MPDAGSRQGRREVDMKLTRASSYALHAVVFMAQQKSTEPVASHNIAKAAHKTPEQKIPERFLLKVLKPLVSARVLRSIKGPNGGYQLARAANEISILEIIEAVDGKLQGYAPAEKGSPSLNHKLEVICNQSAEVVRDNLKKVRISDLIGKKEKITDGNSDEKPARRKAAAKD